MLHSEQKCAYLWNMEQVHSGICELGQLYDNLSTSEITFRDMDG